MILHDVTIALLYHSPSFNNAGMKELWMKARVGESTRFVPLHTIYSKQDKNLMKGHTDGL